MLRGIESADSTPHLYSWTLTPKDALPAVQKDPWQLWMGAVHTSSRILAASSDSGSEGQFPGAKGLVALSIIASCLTCGLCLLVFYSCTIKKRTRKVVSVCFTDLSSTVEVEVPSAVQKPKPVQPDNWHPGSRYMIGAEDLREPGRVARLYLYARRLMGPKVEVVGRHQTPNPDRGRAHFETWKCRESIYVLPSPLPADETELHDLGIAWCCVSFPSQGENDAAGITDSTGLGTGNQPDSISAACLQDESGGVSPTGDQLKLVKYLDMEQRVDPRLLGGPCSMEQLLEALPHHHEPLSLEALLETIDADDDAISQNARVEPEIYGARESHLAGSLSERAEENGPPHQVSATRSATLAANPDWGEVLMDARVARLMMELDNADDWTKVGQTRGECEVMEIRVESPRAARMEGSPRATRMEGSGFAQDMSDGSPTAKQCKTFQPLQESLPLEGIAQQEQLALLVSSDLVPHIGVDRADEALGGREHQDAAEIVSANQSSSEALAHDKFLTNDVRVDSAGPLVMSITPCAEVHLDSTQLRSGNDNCEEAHSLQDGAAPGERQRRGLLTSLRGDLFLDGSGKDGESSSECLSPRTLDACGSCTTHALSECPPQGVTLASLDDYSHAANPETSETVSAQQDCRDSVETAKNLCLIQSAQASPSNAYNARSGPPYVAPDPLPQAAMQGGMPLDDSCLALESSTPQALMQGSLPLDDSCLTLEGVPDAELQGILPLDDSCLVTSE